MIPPPGRLLIVSPHADDAALSCAALLARDEPVEILTVFTGGSASASRTQRDLLQTRRDEERAAFAGGPHRVTLLDLPDPTVIATGRADADGAPVARWLVGWARAGGTVALPVGAGCRWGAVRSRARRVPGVRPGPVRHADHLFLRDVGLAALANVPGVGLLLYEELPYLWCRGGDRQAARAGAVVGLRPTLAVTEVDRRAKAARIAVYASQVGGLNGGPGRVDDPAVLSPVERYWWLRGPRAADGHPTRGPA